MRVVCSSHLFCRPKSHRLKTELKTIYHPSPQNQRTVSEVVPVAIEVPLIEEGIAGVVFHQIEGSDKQKAEGERREKGNKRRQPQVHAGCLKKKETNSEKESFSVE